MKKIIVLFFLVVVFAFPSVASAEDPLIIDTTENYLGTCQLTDKSEFELKSDANVSLFRIWYRWDEGEKELPVTIFHEGQKFAEIKTARSQCDPYQALWCNGDFAINKVFPKGKYTTQIAKAKQCLKPGGTGTVRLFGTAAVEGNSNTVTQEQPQQQPQQQALPTCPSCTNSLIITALIASVAGFLLSFLLFRKKQ